MTLKRDDRIRLFAMDGVNKFEVRNRHDDVVLDADSDYFIYMSNVNLRNGNYIEGRYLGELDEKSPLIDSHCKTAVADADNRQWTVDGKLVRTARMVAVNNKTNVIIVIQQN
jgi:hypothetical protein